MSAVLRIRPMTEADRPFVFDGWAKSYFESRDIAFEPIDMYGPHMHAVIERVVTRCDVLIAEGATERMGFLAYNPGSYTMPNGLRMSGYVYYCYVAFDFRKFGLSRALFRQAGINPSSRFGYAGRTRASFELHDANKIPRAHYDPFHARFPTERERELAYDTARSPIPANTTTPANARPIEPEQSAGSAQGADNDNRMEYTARTSR